MTTSQRMAQVPDHQPFEVGARLKLKARAEFAGIRHRPDGPPVATLVIRDAAGAGIEVEIDFIDLAEVDRFAREAAIAADQLHLARQRRIAREPKGEPE